MKPYFFIIVCFFLFGCASKQERAEKFLKQNPEYFAQLCAINFPVKEEIITSDPIRDTVETIIPGVEIPCPEYVDQHGQKQQPKVKCPDSKIKTINTTITTTITRENTANVIRLKTENNKLIVEKQLLETDNNELNATIKRWKIIAAVVSVLLFGSIYIHFRR